MATLSVRISEEEKEDLLRYGKVSDSVRDAIRFYLNMKKSQSLLSKLEELQRKNVVRTTALQEVKMLKEDRGR